MLFLKIYSLISYLFFILSIRGGYFFTLVKIVIKPFYWMLIFIKYFINIPSMIIHYTFKKSRSKKIIIYEERPKRRYVKLIYYFLVISSFPFLLYFGGFYLVLSGSPDVKNQELLVKLHQYRTAIAVRDENKNLLGIMRNTQTSPSKFVDVDKSGQYIKSFNRESSLYVDIVPDFFWKTLIEREHKRLIFEDEEGVIGYIKGVINGSYRGVDVSAPLRKIINRLLTGKTGGGSTLMNAMVKNLYGGDSYFLIERNRKFECPSFANWHYKVCRKWVEYRAARDLFPLLAKNNGKEFKRWVAMHAPFVGSVGGNQGSLYGLQAASAVMFGDKPKKLNMAQQSFIATSFLWDFRFSTLEKTTKHSEQEWRETCDKELTEWNRTERWECRKRVSKKFAEKVLHNTYKGEELLYKLQTLDYEFKRLIQPKMPKIPVVLQPFFNNDQDNKKEKIKKYANLHTRLDTFMSGFKILLKNGLQEFMKEHSDGHVVELVATLPLGTDLKFRKKIDAVFKKLNKKFSFNKELVNFDKKKNNASIRISVSTLKGDMIRYYLREGEHAIEEKLGLGKPLRPIASIAKIPLVALLVSKGMTEKDNFCNKYYKGLTNAGGDIGVKNCSHTYTLLESLAQSKNLPLRYALGEKTNVTEIELNNLFSDFGIEADLNSQNIDNRNHFIENLSFGRARASAAHTHKIINKVAQMLLYNGADVSFPINSIKNVNFVTYTNEKPQVLTLDGNQKVDELSNIKHYFRTSSFVATMKTLLSAPIKDSKGTLAFLNNISNGSVLFGKTGTFDTDKGNIKDKYVVGVLNVKNRYYTFSILVGSESFKGEGLISKIKTEDLMQPIIQEIINSLYNEKI